MIRQIQSGHYGIPFFVSINQPLLLSSGTVSKQVTLFSIMERAASNSYRPTNFNSFPSPYHIYALRWTFKSITTHFLGKENLTLKSTRYMYIYRGFSSRTLEMYAPYTTLWLHRRESTEFSPLCDNFQATLRTHLCMYLLYFIQFMKYFVSTMLFISPDLVYAINFYCFLCFFFYKF